MYYYRARYYDPSVGRFLQQDPDPGKLNIPMSFLSKYIYVINNPIMMSDPSGQSWLSEAFEYLGVGIVGIADILWGIATLDIARVLTGVAMVVEFMLAPVNFLLNGRLPKYSLFGDGAHVVDNSLLSELFFGDYSFGAGMFLKHDNDGARLLSTKQHEYGHYLQYHEWGGWDYISIGWEQKGKCGSFLEDDADRRAKEKFPGFIPVYGGCN
jgi:hypothetical protein